MRRRPYTTKEMSDEDDDHTLVLAIGIVQRFEENGLCFCIVNGDFASLHNHFPARLSGLDASLSIAVTRAGNA
jgi:hypothetical protein